MGLIFTVTVNIKPFFICSCYSMISPSQDKFEIVQHFSKMIERFLQCDAAMAGGRAAGLSPKILH